MIRLCLSTALALLLITPAARANTIDFTHLDIDATNLWSQDGLTITGDAGALFSSAVGHGLGLVGALNDWSIEGEGSLSIRVDGAIKSMTIQPFETLNGVSVNGTDNAVGFWFGLLTDLLAAGGDNPYYFVDGFTPLTLSYATPRPEEALIGLTRIGLFSDLGQIDTEVYLRAHPDAVLRYGFSITSLDYTPNETVPVPEPGTWLLMAFGGGLLYHRRRLLPS